VAVTSISEIDESPLGVEAAESGVARHEADCSEGAIAPRIAEGTDVEPSEFGQLMVSAVLIRVLDVLSLRDFLVCWWLPSSTTYFKVLLFRFSVCFGIYSFICCSLLGSQHQYLDSICAVGLFQHR
jgi:hypothetical protein